MVPGMLYFLVTVPSFSGLVFVFFVTIFGFSNDAFSSVDVPGRKWSAKCRSLGIFQGARVVRGADWKWENQDGGDGTIGTVRGHHYKIKLPCERTWVQVEWPSGITNKYRCGQNGNMDLKYTKRDTDGDFYIDHLPVLEEGNVRPYVEPGDKVRMLNLTSSKLKELQTERCGWKDEMDKFKGKVGEVVMVDKEGDVKVNFGGSSLFINPVCLALELKKKKIRVEVKDQDGLLAELVKLHMETLVGEDESMTKNALFNAAANGDTEKVREIIGSNPDEVKFHNSKGQTPLHVAAHKGHMEVVKVLIDGKAALEQKDEDGDTALIIAVMGKEPEVVEYLLQRGCDVNNANKQGMTALHLAAAAGHRKCAEILLKHENKLVDMNYKDLKGNSPLFIAIIKNDRRILHMLIEHPRIDLKVLNEMGFNCLHFAAVVNNSYALERILKTAPHMVNIQKNDGYAALHIAAVNNHTDIVLTLINQGLCDINLKTTVGQTALHLATDKSYYKCIEALVPNGANVNAQDLNGNTALHCVLLKDEMEDAFESVPVEKLRELIQKAEHEGESSDAKTKLLTLAMYLINNNADIYIKNNRGQYVLDVTQNPNIRSLIKEVFEKNRRVEPEAAVTKNHGFNFR
ncbi:E3 ubiquitin-protein ligase MIB2-like [Asterias rubens]|uniref:E3 ubiquitin-protein ligase MIB2-like n=1 Tax=Asterias rubens TaxID=7604 RepID=UPI001454FCB1|nr:E3 ubiquitin-protein ligase MIB2-like [Asterias rubens]